MQSTTLRFHYIRAWLQVTTTAATAADTVTKASASLSSWTTDRNIEHGAMFASKGHIKAGERHRVGVYIHKEVRLNWSNNMEVKRWLTIDYFNTSARTLKEDLSAEFRGSPYRNFLSPLRMTFRMFGISGPTVKTENNINAEILWFKRDHKTAPTRALGEYVCVCMYCMYMCVCFGVVGLYWQGGASVRTVYKSAQSQQQIRETSPC